MYGHEALRAEIGAKIEAALARDALHLDPQWITQAVMADHTKISGEDVPFYEFCSRRMVRDEVRTVISQSQTPLLAARQLPLPGMHLQHYYLIEREGEQVAVHLADLTDDEIEGKAREYDKMANACRDHARELREYLDVRRQRQPRGRPQAREGARL